MCAGSGERYHELSMTMPPPLLNRAHIRPGDRVCAAVSGGADSVALLLLLHAANGAARDGLGVGLSAVHVHHGLRGAEADGDLAFVRELCARQEVPLHVHHVSVAERVAASRAAGRGETVEEAARHLRYEGIWGFDRRGPCGLGADRAHSGRPGGDGGDEAAAGSVDGGAERLSIRRSREGPARGKGCRSGRRTGGSCGRCWGCGARSWWGFLNRGERAGGRTARTRMRAIQ